MTPLDLITLSAKLANVVGQGQTLSNNEQSDCFTMLQMMLAEWQERRFDIFQTQDVFIPSTGAQSYSMGPGGDFNVPRPVRVEAAWVEQNPTGGLPVSYPLTPLFAREDYNRITVKKLQSFPKFFFYDSSYPIGNIYYIPIPQAGLFNLHATIMAQLQVFATLQDTFNMPPQYQMPIVYNLACRIAPLFGLPVPQDVKDMARGSIDTLKSGNAQVAQLKMPETLAKTGWYNVYSDQGA